VSRRAALLLLVLVACGRAPEATAPAQPRATAPAPQQEEHVAEIDDDNLLNLAYGASVVSRTAELNLESSAAHAIDGMSFTNWSAPPGGASQTMTYAFGAPARVEKLGVTTAINDQTPPKVRFDASADGKSWREVATVELSGIGTAMKDVTPFEARYLRVTTVEAKPFYAQVSSFHAVGREVGAPEPHSFEGCWTINNRPARLVQRGAMITGNVGEALITGGTDGRVATLMWLDGPMWGYAAATLTPDGNALTAITFHQEPLIGNYGEAWFGTRCDTAGATLAASGERALLQRTGHWTLSGLYFDGKDALVAEASRATLDEIAEIVREMSARRFRIAAYEFRNGNAAEDRRRTLARINAVRAALAQRGMDLKRIEFIAGGSTRKDAEVPSAVQRLLWSRVDLELVKK
jgi:outer membrane protein OmpA-like peptidoglycan-associated protein